MSSCLLALWLCLSSCSTPSAPLVRLTGSDFTGGAASLYGAEKGGALRVNYVYAESTGDHSRMATRFECPPLPAEPLALFLRARLDDGHTPCPVRVSVNGEAVLEGPHLFPSDDWGWRAAPLPPGTLRPGPCEIRVENLSVDGAIGMPPWFMLARAVVAPVDWAPTDRAPIEEDFAVDLPSARLPLPTPLGAGRTEPGFAIRGIKGWLWRPEQYLAEIPVLARYRMNFLMNCYGSMADIEHHAWGAPECNRWWEPLPLEKRAAYAEVVRACQRHGIAFCFSMNPNIGSRRLLRYDSEEDLDLLWRHYRGFQRLGVRWFDIQFDDITGGIDPAGQARFTNALLARLRRHDPEARMLFCPVYYWGTGEEPAARAYLEVLAEELDPSVYVFWTGDAVVGRVTRGAAESYRRIVGHRLFLWDNYPVNDANPTIHLGPVLHRDRDLCAVVEGYLANPLASQNEANRIPLLTQADYAYNPWEYDPARSIGQAILHLSETPEQRMALRDLVELYPGMLLTGAGTGHNPVRARFAEITAQPHRRVLAEAYLAHVEGVLDRLATAFPGRFADARATLAADLDWLREMHRQTYSTHPATGR